MRNRDRVRDSQGCCRPTKFYFSKFCSRYRCCCNVRRSLRSLARSPSWYVGLTARAVCLSVFRYLSNPLKLLSIFLTQTDSLLCFLLAFAFFFYSPHFPLLTKALKLQEQKLKSCLHKKMAPCTCLPIHSTLEQKTH